MKEGTLTMKKLITLILTLIIFVFPILGYCQALNTKEDQVPNHKVIEQLAVSKPTPAMKRITIHADFIEPQNIETNKPLFTSSISTLEDHKAEISTGDWTDKTTDIKLSLFPRIDEGDNITLKVTSSFSLSPVHSNLDAEIHCKNGETILLGNSDILIRLTPIIINN